MKRTLLIVAISLAIAGSAQAAVLYQESFNYADGALAGNAGWTDPVPGWQIASNQATGTGTYGTGHSGAGSLSAVATAADAGTTVYATMLLREAADKSCGSRIRMEDSGGTRLLYGGLNRGNSIVMESDTPTTSQQLLAAGLDSNTIHMIAMKIDVDTAGNDTMSYAINPTLPAEPTWTLFGACEINDIDSYNIDDMRGAGNNTGNLADEFRWADSWADVIGGGGGVLGDANSDGQVTLADYTIWSDTYESTTDLRADWNDSGDVTIADYTIWSDNYTGAGAVPEPAILVVLLLGSGLILAAKRRR